MLLNPLFGLGRGAVIDGDFVPAFVLQMPRHRVAHDTQAQKRHLRHYRSPLEISSWPAAADAYLPIGHCGGKGVNHPALTASPPRLWCRRNQALKDMQLWR